ncbi:DUF11 domain-containing protein [Granulosicoccus antarcticus]|uniref:DUF11 domain-containing protein n=1 Tax=Granulosicoccus antarcticus IMCC3135 TaxID=1192854 RepID=A0A2Z2P7C8_9GAMM|nr:DUF11 domain-containing protein [Granulosicoccus antarcticus]ASJ76597.1 hypothetical protein IMCC3135_32760 [Granulosicoccus antarcticus IMCC3135]
MIIDGVCLPDKVHRRRWNLTERLLSCLCLSLLLCAAAIAATPVGSVIRNQASATYKDSNGVEQFTTSNIVETTIQQVAGVELTQDQNKLTASGGEVSFPHVLSNTGNGADTFTLIASNLAAGDDYDFNSIEIFADIDQNGVADDAIALTESPALAAGESFHFVIVTGVPGVAGATDTAGMEVVATSSFDTGQSVSNTDSATVTAAALIDVVKSMSALGGDSPDGPFTVTLSYRNDSASSAAGVTLIDALPAGMSYVAGSGRWSVTGSLVLTDSNSADVQGSAPASILYCAYEAGCTGLPEAVQDADSSSANQVTAILNEVGPGESGTLEFDVTIDSDVTAIDLVNTAEFEYDGGAGTTARVNTNSVAFAVAQAVGVVANGSDSSSVDGTDEAVTVASAFQGSTVAFENVIWNTGNGTDSFDVIVDSGSSTFPAGTAFQLFQGDGLTPLVDSSGNGIPDTGPLAPAGSYRVVLKASLPPSALGDNGGAGYQVTKRARSTTDPSIFNDVTDSLGQILPSSVDLTNNAATGNAGALGEGAGPEASAEVSNVAIPGNTTQFILYASNIGNIDDTFDLAVSTDSTFASETLPAGWSVTFRSSDDTTDVSSTGNIAVGTSVRILADVSVPAGQAPVEQSLYFRILSPATGAVDVLHDAVSVVDASTLLLEPDSHGQLEPGGAIVYTHQLKNVGNATITGIDLSTVDSLVADGWSSAVYEDTDDDGVFTAADQLISTVAALPAGTTKVLFVKVVAPANAAYGAADTTLLTASWNSGADSVEASNVTTVDAGDIGIVKEQALDLGCDGVLDGAYTRQPFAVEPGNNCVQYRLTATNAGVEPVFNAIIQDATPAFTVYRSSATCSATVCTITEPVDGGTGLVTGEVATVEPGESVEFIFAVVIE